MNHAKPPSDPHDHAEPLEDELLRRALAPRRPRPDAFRSGVQKRIQEKRSRLEAERQRQELRLAQAPEHVRWLAGIARNLHRTDVRKSSSEEPIEDALSENDAAEPHEVLHAHDEAEAVCSAIEALPDREREAVKAFYLEETPTIRVAALLETSERAVEGLLRRARARLKQALAAVANEKA